MYGKSKRAEKPNDYIKYAEQYQILFTKLQFYFKFKRVKDKNYQIIFTEASKGQMKKYLVISDLHGKEFKEIYNVKIDFFLQWFW